MVRKRRRPDLNGFEFTPVREGEAVEHILDALVAGKGGRVVTPNVDILHRGSYDPEAADLIRRADLVIADGAPVVWALRLQGTPVPERVAGSALGPLLAAGAAERGIGVFLLGGNPGSAEVAARRLHDRHPDLRVDWHFPPFGFEGKPGELDRVRRALEAFGPCLCFVGLGFPKQDRLGSELLEVFPESWFIGAGATIGFLAGEFSRAPRWMQLTGLEWAHRLVLEPRRLARRYLLNDAPFALHLLLGAARRRLLGGWR